MNLESKDGKKQDSPLLSVSQIEKQETHTPFDDQIKHQLERILSSALFRSTSNLSIFLQYVVTETLNGRAARIKGYTIASDVFDRSDTEKSDASTIVRVEAGRLRNRLQNYYINEGKHDPVYIEIPKGTYVPTFELKPENLQEQHNKQAPVEPSSPATAIATKTTAKQTLIALLVLITVSISIGWLHPFKDAKNNSILNVSDPNYSQAPGNPSIMIFPFENLIEGASGEKLAKGITEDIITDMSRLQGLDVIALSSILSLKETTSDYMDAANELGVKYILYGSLRGDGNTNNIRITAQLYASKSGNQLWARRYDRVMTDSLKLQDELAILIVQSIAEPLKIITPLTDNKAIERRMSYTNKP